MDNRNDERLRALTAPDTVALIGASDNPASLTARPMRFLTANDFSGRICPVNPRRSTVLGLPAYPSVKDIPGRVDHAYVLVNTDAVIDAVVDCAAAGVRVVSVLADGFAEAGPEGLARQARLIDIAREAGMLLIGPNSMGVVNTANGFVCTTNAAFRAAEIGKGRLTVLSQSGSIIGSLLSRGHSRGVSFRTLISLGNEAATGVGGMGLALVDDPDTDAFLLFLETIRDAPALAEFGRRAAEAGKPVVAYVIGRTEEGQALSVSHTGALTGSTAAVAAFLRANHISQVDLFDTFLEAPGALARTRLKPGRRRTATVVSTTGGGGAMVIDQLSMRGVEIAGCSAASRAKLEAQNIPVGHGKLVDVTLAGARYEVMKEVVSTLMADPETGLLVVAIGSSAQFDPELAVKPIVDAVRDGTENFAPVVAVPIPHAPESLAMLRDGGVTAFGSVEVASETISIMMAAPSARPVRARHESLPLEVMSLIDRAFADAGSGAVLDEHASGEIFAALGVELPAQRLLPPGTDAAPVDGLTYPVVAKIVSPDLPHKTEAGAVRLNLRDAGELAAAVTGMRESARHHHRGFRDKGTLVQEMRRGLGEALIGLTRDPLVGPVVTVGCGGTLAEIYRDVSIRPAPVTLEEARGMIADIKGFEPLRGYRGARRGDLEALARTVVAASRLLEDARVAEAELNPVLVGAEGEGAIAVDALIRLSAD